MGGIIERLRKPIEGRIKKIVNGGHSPSGEVVEYAIRAKVIGDLQIKLFPKDYDCYECIEQDQIACCIANIWRIDPEEMQRYQELEALASGWTRKKWAAEFSQEDNERRCDYHSREGCKTELFKPPLCLGHLCNYEFFFDTYGSMAEPFVKGMKDLHKFGSKGIPGTTGKIIKIMDMVVDGGVQLIEAKKGITSSEQP